MLSACSYPTMILKIFRSPTTRTTSTTDDAQPASPPTIQPTATIIPAAASINNPPAGEGPEG
jgi:hypothetical protein